MKEAPKRKEVPKEESKEVPKEDSKEAPKICTFFVVVENNSGGGEKNEYIPGVRKAFCIFGIRIAAVFFRVFCFSDSRMELRIDF